MPVKIKNKVKHYRAAYRVAAAVLCLFFVSPAFAQVATSWHSYTHDGFNSVTILSNPANGANCPPKNGQTCDGIMAGHTEVVCPNDYMYESTHTTLLPKNFALIRRIMPCVKETMLTAAHTYFGPIVTSIGYVVAAASTLALVLLGALMIGGRSSSTWRDAAALAIKLGVVSYLMSHLTYDPNNPGGVALFPMALDIMDQLVAKVSLYAINGSTFGFAKYCSEFVLDTDPGTAYVIWDYMDCNIHMIIGQILNAFNSSTQTIAQGMIGFLMACIVTKGVGLVIGFIIGYMMIQFLWAVVRSLYMYVTAYFGVALCMVIAPFIIPTILFRSTNARFANWIRTTAGFMLQPVIIAAYLGMLITAFDILIFTGPNSIVRSIAGSDVDCIDYKTNPQYPRSFMDRGGLGLWMIGYQNPDCPAWGGYVNYQPAWNITSGKSVFQRASLINQRKIFDPRSTGIYHPIISAPDYGTPGHMATTDHIGKSGQDLFEGFGVDPDNIPAFVGVDVKVIAVDWSFLRAFAYFDKNGTHYHDSRYDPNTYSNYDDPDGEATNAYLIDLLKSAIMAFLVGFIFLKMLDALPFLGASLAMGSGVVEGLGSKTLGAGNLAPPGKNTTTTPPQASQ